MTDPFVCVPMAGTSPEATAAAEPAGDPPGVCSEDSGFLVRAGFKNANSVVSVLPNMTAPAASSASIKTARLPQILRPSMLTHIRVAFPRFR